MTASVRTSVPIRLERAGGAAFTLVSFTGLSETAEHVAIVSHVDPGPRPLIRIHSECLTGDCFGSTRCDCGAQLTEALLTIGEKGGAVLYLRQEGRGIGLYRKLDSYVLQDDGLDTYEANRRLGRGGDERQFGVAGEILKALGWTRVSILTNNPDKIAGLISAGIEVMEVQPTTTFVHADNRRYLSTKARFGRHTLDIDGSGAHGCAT